MKFAVADDALLPLGNLHGMDAHRKGLTFHIGLAAVNTREQMRREHSSRQEFFDSTHKVTSSPAREWARIMEPNLCGGSHKTTQSHEQELDDASDGHGDVRSPVTTTRRVLSLSELMQLQEVVAAGLSEDEAVAGSVSVDGLCLRSIKAQRVL